MAVSTRSPPRCHFGPVPPGWWLRRGGVSCLPRVSNSDIVYTPARSGDGSLPGSGFQGPHSCMQSGSHRLGTPGHTHLRAHPVHSPT